MRKGPPSERRRPEDGLFQDFGLENLDGFDRNVAHAAANGGLDGGDLVDDVFALDDAPEDGVAVAVLRAVGVQEVVVRDVDVELARVRAIAIV